MYAVWWTWKVNIRENTEILAELLWQAPACVELLASPAATAVVCLATITLEEEPIFASFIYKLPLIHKGKFILLLINFMWSHTQSCESKWKEALRTGMNRIWELILISVEERGESDFESHLLLKRTFGQDITFLTWLSFSGVYISFFEPSWRLGMVKTSSSLSRRDRIRYSFIDDELRNLTCSFTHIHVDSGLISLTASVASLHW